MSGNARVANDNDIYLPNSRVVTITGALSNNPVARITPENYNASTQVLTGSEVASEHGKFTVTPKSGTPPEYWGISNSGNLTRDNASIFNTISKDQIQAADSSMSNAIISNRKANLEGKLILYKTTDNNYGIMHVTEVDNTSEGGTGHIEFDYKTFNSDGSIKKSENYKKLEGQSLFNLDDESTGYVTEIDFILRNIDNTDAGKHFEPQNSAKFYVLP